MSNKTKKLKGELMVLVNGCYCWMVRLLNGCMFNVCPGNFFNLINFFYNQSFNNRTIEQFFNNKISIQFLQSKYNYDKGTALLFEKRSPVWHIAA
jgi:hypothetical protein